MVYVHAHLKTFYRFLCIIIVLVWQEEVDTSERRVVAEQIWRRARRKERVRERSYFIFPFHEM